MPDLDNDDEAGSEAVTRAFWSGTITFGLVSIPVALYAANRSQRVSLRMVSPKGTPLNRRYYTSKDDKPLDTDDIVRGYEVEKGRFVLVDDDELERLAPERTRDIDVRQFVDAGEVDPMYFERAYFLTPAGGSNKAYRLLARVMEETGRAGIATFVLRDKEYLVAIIAENGILRAETLRFADELRTPADVGLPEPARVKPAQVKRIDREIGKRMAAHLDRKELVDHSADKLLKLAREKMRSGKGVVEPDEDEAEDRDDGGRPVIDLMEVLKRRMAGIETDDDTSPRAESDEDGDDASSPSGGGDLADATKAELYERAKKLDIPGRSAMTRDQLANAIRRSA
ncbi:MAG TPA: Ku protein [Longimicrobium sp.]|nr:Ku protein [Longimicrobium sp.]